MVHEWALAEAIVEYIDNLALQKSTREIEYVTIRLGLLQSIDVEILDYALREILEMKGLKIHSIKYEEVDVNLQCRRCGFKWSIDLNSLDEAVRESIHFIPEAIYSFFKCPNCGSRDFEIVSGRGVEIGEIKWIERS